MNPVRPTDCEAHGKRVALCPCVAGIGVEEEMERERGVPGTPPELWDQAAMGEDEVSHQGHEDDVEAHEGGEGVRGGCGRRPGVAEASNEAPDEDGQRGGEGQRARIRKTIELPSTEEVEEHM